MVPGQYVAQGQVLVSGMTLSQYERPLYSHAQAEVLAEVEKAMYIPSRCMWSLYCPKP